MISMSFFTLGGTKFPTPPSYSNQVFAVAKRLHDVLRTILGFFWIRTEAGGRLPDLCDLDVEQFREIASDRRRAINCIPESDARQLVYLLHEKRCQFAIGFLMALHCPGLVPKLKDMYPSAFPDDDTINSICERANLKICRPQTPELVRRHCCKYERVQAFCRLLPVTLTRSALDVERRQDSIERNEVI
jgi:hypothetical protein